MRGAKMLSPLPRQPDFLVNRNDQSLVEICIARLTSAVRETQSVEGHVRRLVVLLETCLTFDLRPSNDGRDPPHAKVASDVMSCIFLVGVIPRNKRLSTTISMSRVSPELLQEEGRGGGFAGVGQVPAQG